jgi:hydroxymethylpyrimidine/phosphomethylpyrimidine kinase
MTDRPVPAVLSIAGSDSGGGAGIQADLKAFARCGVHGMTAITALTAQNTVGVEAIEMVPPKMIIAQVRAVARDIGVDAVKIGMLGNAATVEAVVEALETYVGNVVPVVLDPVMVAESGARLLDDEACDTLVEKLLPLVTIATPNIPEAQVLSGLGDDASQEDLARAVQTLGPDAVVVTGGHSAALVDLFFDGDEPVEIPGERHPGEAAHGSGCTHSSAIAAFLARGAEPLQAAAAARQLASLAVGAGLDSLGKGPGPVDVFDLAARARADAEPPSRGTEGAAAPAQ